VETIAFLQPLLRLVAVAVQGQTTVSLEVRAVALVALTPPMSEVLVRQVRVSPVGTVFLETFFTTVPVVVVRQKLVETQVPMMEAMVFLRQSQVRVLPVVAVVAVVALQAWALL
jgi:hypothetical protein